MLGESFDLGNSQEAHGLSLVWKSSTRVMVQASSEMLWEHWLFHGLGFLVQGAMSMFCDNQVAIFLQNNHTFYEPTKYIEINCNTVGERVLRSFIATSYVAPSNQLVNIFTKELNITSYESSKLGLFDLYVLA